jgi:hypothetical protein
VRDVSEWAFGREAALSARDGRWRRLVAPAGEALDLEMVSRYVGK